MRPPLKEARQAATKWLIEQNQEVFAARVTEELALRGWVQEAKTVSTWKNQKEA